MKKSSIFAGVLAGALAILSFSCESLNGAIQTPTAEIKSVSIAGLDLEGISFNCNYAIKNPYGISLSVKDITMDVECKDSKVTTLNTNKGLTINAQTTSSNQMSFKVPYDSVLELAKNYAASKTLPFDIDGEITIDTSSIPALAAIGTNSLTLPLSANFEVPVFKPNLSVSNFNVVLPSLSDLKNQLTHNGVGITKAIQIATTLLSGEKITASIFDGIAMDIDFKFDLNVKNEGSANWDFKIQDCSLSTSTGTIADVGPASKTTTVSSQSATVPMKATLNTIETGAFIIQLLNKTGADPVFNLKSGLSFPDTSYSKNIPLNYSFEIPLSSIKK